MALKANAADIKYVQLMIPHHQLAVDASAKEYMDGTSPEIHKLASDIMASQKEQIKFMKDWLKQVGAPEKGSGNMKM
jgi:uncharacterized protein (DUF305 family)